MGESAAKPLPLVIQAGEVAKLLNRSTGWFYTHREKLEKAGFPKRDHLLGGWLRLAVEDWLARRAGIRSPSPSAAKDRLRRAIDARKNAVRHSAA